jgi:type I restriction enzyme S subunit
MLNLITDHLDVWASAELPAKPGSRGRSASNGKSPHGIQKLRELILELAVRGKLVPQDADWKPSKLGKLGRWAVGSGFPTAEQGLSGLEILFVKVSDMNLPENTKFILASNHTISRETAGRLRVNIHPEGTVVFPKIGGAIATNKRRILSVPTAIDNNCLGITPRDGVSTEWLYMLLTSIDFTQYQAGTSVPALAQGVLEEIDLLLPPLVEQHRIVDKVDELMAMCDQLEQEQTDNSSAHKTLVETLLATLTQAEGGGNFAAAWQRIAEHFDTLFTTEQSIDQLKQTLLQLAVMGKLVPQDHNDEPASELLKKIAAEKLLLIKEKKIKNPPLLPLISDDEKPFQIPAGWEYVRLNDLGEWGAGATPLRNRHDYYGGDIPWFKSGELTDDYIGESEERVTDLALKETSLRYNKPGDVLLAMYGATIGKTSILRIAATTNQAVCACTPFKGFSNIYLLTLLKAYKNRFVNQGAGGAQPNISREKIIATVVALPPTLEQHRIVAKVDELMAICDTLKARLNEAHITQIQLADAIVEQAVA